MFYLKTEIVAFERIGFKNRLRFASVFVGENNPKLFKKHVKNKFLQLAVGTNLQIFL